MSSKFKTKILRFQIENNYTNTSIQKYHLWIK